MKTEFANKQELFESLKKPVKPIKEVKFEPRAICEIASEIRRLWRPVYFGAKPYLDAMLCLQKKTDKYGVEDAKTIVLYFLSNASTFRGEDAKRLKAELKLAIK